MSKPVIWEGVEYPSLSAAAHAVGMSVSNMHRLINLGYTSDADRPRHRGPDGIKCEWNGVRYESIYHASQSTGYHQATMRLWIKSGYTCDDDVFSLVEWNGAKYKSVAEAVKHTGHSNLYYYLSKGFTCDSDLEQLRRPRVCEWNGVQYPSLQEAADALGITREAMRLRVNKGYACDQDMADAAHTPRATYQRREKIARIYNYVKDYEHQYGRGPRVGYIARSLHLGNSYVQYQLDLLIEYGCIVLLNKRPYIIAPLPPLFDMEGRGVR